jgi:hypothetical protein
MKAAALFSGFSSLSPYSLKTKANAAHKKLLLRQLKINGFYVE